jgi:hypothetical protein
VAADNDRESIAIEDGNLYSLKYTKSIKVLDLD